MQNIYSGKALAYLLGIVDTEIDDGTVIDLELENAINGEPFSDKEQCVRTNRCSKTKYL